jgi:hypothetical protein
MHTMKRLWSGSFCGAVALAAAGCWLWEPPAGQGPRADEGFAHATPVIRALAHFKADRDSFPASLLGLVPSYLPDTALRLPPGWTAQNDLRYRRTDHGYLLGFWYSGPFSNTCTYEFPSQGWRCSGAV